MFVRRDRSIEFSAEDRARIGPDVEAWVGEMEGRGVRLEGHTLAPPDDAVMVRVRGGEVLVADGPLVDANEPISGFNVLDCVDVDEATEVASKHPIARFGTIELRAYGEQ
jgi:hypothetical protein